MKLGFTFEGVEWVAWTSGGGAYGTGNKPVLKWTGGFDYGTIFGTIDGNDVTVRDLAFDSKYTTLSEVGYNDAIRMGGKNITVRGLSLTGTAATANVAQMSGGTWTGASGNTSMQVGVTGGQGGSGLIQGLWDGTVTGRPGRTFRQWAAEHADDFR